ncbi:MAG: hypothetical protein H0T42_14150 [Deltaproteobacteria bacterium]|nr:hypothetical protein [Deltaproteobacteria bacterium]
MTRFRSNVLTILSIALFVTGSAVGLSVYLSLRSAVIDTSPPENILVLGKGASGEGGSKLTLDTARKIVLLDGLSKAGDGPLASRELVSGVYVNTADFSRYHAPVTIRGIDEQSTKVHHVTVIEGSAPQSGTLQVMIGRRLAKDYPELRIGADISLPGGAAPITGVFSSEGSPFEFEVWTPRAALELHTKAKNSSSMTIVAESAARVPEIIASIKGNKSIEAEAISVRESRANGAGLERILKIVLILLVLLSIVAASAIATTMNAAVAVRMPELGALVAIGVRRSMLGRLVVLESVLLATIGTIIGVIVNELIHRMVGSIGPFELVSIAIVPVVAVGLGLLMGLIGGLVPAMSVRRLDVIKAMR